MTIPTTPKVDMNSSFNEWSASAPKLSVSHY